MATAAASTVQSLTGTRLPAEQVAAIQRSKILAAAAQTLARHGHARATVSEIVSCARVSRTAFYALFTDRDECLAAILDQAAATIECELIDAEVPELSWPDRVAAGLLAILRLLDREPVLARVCVVEALRCGPVVLERRAAILRRLVEAVDEGGRRHGRGELSGPLVAEGLVGAVFAIVHVRIVRGSQQPLADLAPDLTRMLLLPYAGKGRARRGQARTLRSPRLAEGLRAESARRSL
jgi:AcrR family transcriptional regulator